MANNIGYLKQDLIDHNWHMTAFPFRFKGNNYDVLFENNDNIEVRANKFASVILTFIDVSDPLRTYTVEANQRKMFHNVKEFRSFFGIEYSPNLGNILSQFYDNFVEYVPMTVPRILNNRQTDEIIQKLAQRDGHNPNAVYCYDARRLGKRNGKQMHRSIFISNLTELKKPMLYAHFREEPTVTFYYSENPADELLDIEILNKFSEREAAAH